MAYSEWHWLNNILRKKSMILALVTSILAVNVAMGYVISQAEKPIKAYTSTIEKLNNANTLFLMNQYTDLNKILLPLYHKTFINIQYLEQMPNIKDTMAAYSRIYLLNNYRHDTPFRDSISKANEAVQKQIIENGSEYKIYDYKITNNEYKIHKIQN